MRKPISRQAKAGPVVRLLMTLVCCAISVAFTSTATASEASSLPEVPLSLQPPFSSVVPPTAGQLEADAASRTLYEGLDKAEAVSLAARAFRITRPVWQAPGAEGEGQVESYVNNLAAVEETPRGGKVVVASTVPLRVNNGGGLAPTSLALKEEGGSFAPENPVVPVSISSRAAGGITFPEGLQVTPVATSATEAPVVVGDKVVFANVARDTDLMSEATPGGAEISWQIRSQAAPADQQLLFHLPAGVVLRPSSAVPGGAEVVVEGKQVLLVEPALAQDAEGHSVPVSYSIEGSTLGVHVDLGGAVHFPVLVDPAIVVGEYGGWEGGSTPWTSWASNEGKEGCSPQCFSFIETNSLLQTGANVGAPIHTVGAWTVTAPGYANKPGSAGITRVDLSGVIHSPANQSQLIATIEESDGGAPVFSWNGTGGLSGPLPLYDSGELNNQAIAFCAQSDNGKDGGNPPLCDEEYHQGRSFVIEDELLSAPTVFNYVRVGGAKVTFRDATYPNRVELIHSGNPMEWVKSPPSYKVSGEDEGLGLKKVEIQAPYPNAGVFKEEIQCTEAHGFHGCPNSWESGSTNLPGLLERPSGEYSLTAVAVDAANNAQPAKTPVPLFLDHEGPVISFSGPLAEAAGGVIGEGSYLLHFTAADGAPGSAQTVQSGTRSMEVKVDGRSVFSSSSICSKPEGPPAEGCYALAGSWTMGAQSYGVGTHTITVTAKDWVGNESTKTLTVTVNGSAYEPLGPGSVNLTTGDYKLSSNDVSISAGPASLGVSRSYDSRNLTRGAEGPLGPEWALSLPDESAADWQSLTALSGGNVMLTAATGAQAVFTAKQGGFNSPAGYQNLTLTQPGKTEAFYELTDAEGNYAQFTLPSSGSLYVPTTVGQASGAGGLNKVTYSFTRTGEGITEPTKVLGPEPSKGACATTLVKGCRELTFNYASTTTATGEGPSQWGDYKGRLTRVYFTGWDPAKGEISAPITVAQYAYDSKGRLRAEWDPRIEPALKTTYGLDSENHVTAVTPAGQQPWLIHMGTGIGDPVTGRALSVTRPAATTVAKLKERDEKAAPSNTAVPTLSTSTPTIGTTMSVSGVGTWSNEPLAYAYQWQRCSSTGSECQAIEGATNKTYTPQARDGGYTLKAQVTATNIDGTTLVPSAATSVIAMPAPTSASRFTTQGCSGVQKMSSPIDDTVSPSGEVWVADAGNSCVEEFSPSGQHTGTCSEGIANPLGVAVTSSHIYVADHGLNRIEMFSPSGGCSLQKTFGASGSGPGQLKEPDSVATDPEGNVWVVDTGNKRLEEFSSEGVYTTSFNHAGADSFSNPTAVAFANGNLYIVDGGNNRVVIATPTGELVGQFGSAGTGNGQFSAPTGIATDPVSGDLYVGDTANNRIEQFNPAGAYVAKFGSLGGGETQLNTPIGIAVNSTGGMYVVDNANNRVQKWVPAYSTNNPAPTAPTSSGESIWSVDYHIPLSGSGLPELGNYSKWGQTDKPIEGTAIFPPDEPMGWPAASYKRAMITYLDALDRAVNTALPGGGTSTTEYDEHDNITRTLTADNRVRAIEAGELSEQGTKIKEEAEQLDTKYTYSSDGTERTSTLGPRHPVKLPNGTTVSARKHIVDAYDGGAPETGGPYRLLTTSTEGAYWSLPGHPKEEDIHTVTNSYSGQSNLGWKLHTPTSVTVSTGTQSLTTTTLLSSTTGEATETRTPDGSYGKPVPFAYLSQFGPGVGEAGNLSEPRALAQSSSGNELVLNFGKNTIDEFSATGAFVKEFAGTGTGLGQLSSPYGIAADSKGNTWVADTGNNRVEKFNAAGEGKLVFGSAGTGNGQFKEDKGIAVSPTGTVFVSDAANNRIEKFSEAGAFIEAIGFGVADGQNQLESCKTACRAGIAGSGNGQLNEPRGIALSNGNLLIADYGNNRVDVLTEAGAFVRTIGAGELSLPKGLTADTAGNVFVADTGHNTIKEYTTTGVFLWEAGTKGTGAGQFEEPWAIAVTATDHLYIADRFNNRVDQWVPTMLGNPAAHDTQTIYYTPGTEASLVACQNHPEWAGLPCQEQPAAQPEDGLPVLASTGYTYNIWNQPLTTVDTAGTTTRTTTVAYSGKSERESSVSIVSGIGTPIATTSFTFNESNGSLATQSRTTEGVTKKLTSELNTLGQPIGYTDADGNTTTETYDEDYRPKTISDGKGSQTFGYSTTSGWLTSVADSAAGTFTAGGYDAEGNLTSQGYPNGMSANYLSDSTGAQTSIEYIKTSHCTTGCTWYKQSALHSIHGETLTQASTLASSEFAFDQAGRLTEAKTTPAGQGCTTLLYGYELDSNRTTLTTRPPGTGGACATSGGTTTTSTFDSGERLDEPGFEYDAFGNTKTVPAADAGGYPLTSTFYANNRLASVTQNGETIGYQLDPAERARETVSTGKTSADVISHYDGPGESPAWSEEPINGHWTRNISGLSGGLEAIQTNNGTSTVEIKLTNLHGDVIGTAKDSSETETHLESASEASEYGVPNVANPPKYSWLGELQRPTELPSGMIAMGARGYIPQLGRFLQTDPTPGGSNNPYGYTNENPINEADPTGEWTTTTSYNYEAAETGQATIPIEGYIEAGAIMPPPVNLQTEEAIDANPPWNAVATLEDLPQIGGVWEQPEGSTRATVARANCTHPTESCTPRVDGGEPDVKCEGVGRIVKGPVCAGPSFREPHTTPAQRAHVPGLSPDGRGDGGNGDGPSSACAKAAGGRARAATCAEE